MPDDYDLTPHSVEMSLRDVIELMVAEFGTALTKDTIKRVVRQCGEELELLATPLPTATLECMARQRLSHLAPGGWPAAP